MFNYSLPNVKGFAEFRFSESYYFANIINNIIHDPVPYLRNLEGFWGDQNLYSLIRPYEKFTVLHQLIEFIVGDIYFENASEESIQNSVTSLERSLKSYCIDHMSILEWMKAIGCTEGDSELVTDYYSFLMNSGPFEKLIDTVTSEVFHLLFTNRLALYNFHTHLAAQISMLDIDEIPREYVELFKANGILKRKNPFQWAKMAVYFRDHGHCVACRKDLSNLVTNQNGFHYDHIVPLSCGGVNDVTNLQLLCAECNSTKAAHNVIPNLKYQKWF